MTNRLKVTNIYWDRIWLYFDVELPDGASSHTDGVSSHTDGVSSRAHGARAEKFPTLYLECREADYKARLHPVDESDEFYCEYKKQILSDNDTTKSKSARSESAQTYKINITNPGNCKMIRSGHYYLTDGCIKAVFSTALAKRLSEISRDFPYGHDECYKVEFYLPKESVHNSDSSKEGTTASSDSSKEGTTASSDSSKEVSASTHRHHKVRIFFHDTKGPKYSVSKATKLKKTLFTSAYKFFQTFEHKKVSKKDPSKLKNGKQANILLFSDQSESIGTNMEALKQELEKEGFAFDTEFRSILTKSYPLTRWFSTVKKLARANYIFLDDHSPTTNWLTLRDTKVIQLWHAGAGFKSTGYSRFGLPASPGPESGHRQYTYGIAGSRKIRHFFSEVWGINETMVLPTGMPRIDAYLDAKNQASAKDELYRAYPILKDKKVILFAPTYRGKNKGDAFYPYDLIDFKKLAEVCGDEYVVVFKMHPFVAEPVPIPEEYKDKMLDLGTYPDINRLFYITDLLITDYSSNIYEFSLMKKPMLFFAYDEEEYATSRGFHRNYEGNVPGKIVRSFGDLLTAIEKKDFEYERVEEYINTNFDHYDSNSCMRIIDWVIRGKLPDKYRKEITEEKKDVIEG